MSKFPSRSKAAFKATFVGLAKRYLKATFFHRPNSYALRFWRGEFWRWTGSHYERLAEAELRAGIMAWLQQVASAVATPAVATGLVANLQGLTLIRADIEPPVWLGTPYVRVVDLIPLRNGILDVARLIAGDPQMLLRASPEFFCLASLPHHYNPNATCPTWTTRFLERTQPDPANRDLLQEWFGYNLVPDTTLERFVLLTGIGANGKTVICTVLRELLGERNVSAVGLEAFSEQRTFPLAATVGKLANIVEDLAEQERVAEGLLKRFVSGGVITVERKHRDPFEMLPSARLTLACNTLPRFADRSDGLWRRLIVAPCAVQIPEAERDPRLLDPRWWRGSGELPGVLNWALEGLIRLRLRGRFEEPPTCREAKEAYRRDSNPAAEFLRVNCEAGPGKEVPAKTLLDEYSDRTKASGQKPLTAQQFAAEVRRIYPEAQLSPNPERIPGGVRCRMWRGIGLVGQTSWD